MNRLLILLLSILVPLTTVRANSNEVDSLFLRPDDELRVFVNGRELTGEEKRVELLHQREFISTAGTKLGGVGLPLFTTNGDFLVATEPLAGSPAAKAGIRKGDMIVAVDHQPLQGLLITDVVNRIRGESGTKVTLTIQRSNLMQPFDVELTREEIRISPPVSRVFRRLVIIPKDLDLSPEELEGASIRTNEPSPNTQGLR